MRCWTLVIVYPVLGLLLSFSPGYCQDCSLLDIMMGRYFFKHPDICTKFLQCAQSAGGFWYPKPRDCSPGLFWDEYANSCRVPSALRSPCVKDPCRGSGMVYYEAENHCRSFFRCNGSATDRMLCCKHGYKYDPVIKVCVLDIMRECTNDVCTEGPLLVEPPCRLTEFRMDRRFFYENVPSFGAPNMIMRSCPSGTAFNEGNCGCTDKVPVTFSRACYPSLTLNFAGNVVRDFGVDGSPRQFVKNVNVITNSDLDLGMFNGNQTRLLIPRYANHDWRDEFIFFVIFATQNIVQDDAVLLANSGCPGLNASIKLAVKNTNFLEGSIILEGGERVSVTVPFATMGLNLAMFIYDGAILKLAVTRPDQTESVQEIPISGNVALRQCSFSIGYGTDSNFFKGFIDWVQVLLCK